MPYKSDKQRKWAHSPTGMKALGGKKKVAEWDAESKGMDLPESAKGTPKRVQRKKSPIRSRGKR